MGATVGAAMIPTLVVLVIAAVVFHLAIPVSVFMLVIAAGVLGQMVCRAVGIRLLFQAGQWRTLDGRILRRAEHPRRFWTQVALGGVIVLITLVAAGWLVWFALFPSG